MTETKNVSIPCEFPSLSVSLYIFIMHIREDIKTIATIIMLIIIVFFDVLNEGIG